MVKLMIEALSVSRATPTLTVAVIGRSIDFYVNGLGFVLVNQFHDGQGAIRSAILRAGKAYLGITQDDFARGRDRAKGGGFRLFLETSQPIDELAGRAKASGIEVEGPMTLPWGGGVQAIAIRDPDGYALTICARAS